VVHVNGYDCHEPIRQLDWGNAQNKEMTLTGQHLVPYINFQGQAREAMEFYQRVLGGTLQLHAGGEQGQPRPAEPGDRIMIADGIMKADELAG
jgi:hypothetical protein